MAAAKDIHLPSPDGGQGEPALPERRTALQQPGGDIFDIFRSGAVRQAHGGDGGIVQFADQPGVGTACRGIQQGAEHGGGMAVRCIKIVEMQRHVAAADHAQAGGVSLDEAEVTEGVLPRFQQL